MSSPSPDRKGDLVDRDQRIVVVGQIPPPVNGQALMTSHLVDLLAGRLRDLRVVNTSEGIGARWLQIATKLGRSLRAFWAIRGSDVVYMPVNNGQGMWVTTMISGWARLLGLRVFLHHHSYSYVRERKARMVVLTRIAGPRAYHVVLCPTMAKELLEVMPEIREPLVCGPAWRVEKELLDLRLREDGGELVLGHLSNLSIEKGIVEVVNLAVALNQAGVPLRLLVGGPISDGNTRGHLDRAAEELGDRFEYLGPLAGDSKQSFFGRITHFIFPSRYIHEAVPAVLYEALAAGAVCVATRQGLIPDQLQGSPSLLADHADSFVEETLATLTSDESVTAAASRESRQAFLRAESEAEADLALLVAVMLNEGLESVRKFTDVT